MVNNQDLAEKLLVQAIKLILSSEGAVTLHVRRPAPSDASPPVDVAAKPRVSLARIQQHEAMLKRENSTGSLQGAPGGAPPKPLDVVDVIVEDAASLSRIGQRRELPRGGRVVACLCAVCCAY